MLCVINKRCPERDGFLYKFLNFGDYKYQIQIFQTLLCNARFFDII